MTVLFYNNAQTTLGGNLSSVATTVTLASGGGALFSPGPTGGDYFCVTLTPAAGGSNKEIVHCTNVTGDVLTIVRAQEGTTAQTWSIGDNIANLPTAASIAQLKTATSDLQIDSWNYAVDSGTANAIVVTLSPVPASYASIVGSAFRIKKSAAANTGAVTINMNSLGAKNLVHGDGTPVIAGELSASVMMAVVYDSTNFILQGPRVSPAVLQVNSWNYAADTGTANALVATLSPAPASLASIIGTPIRVLKGGSNNTGACTLALNGLAATSITHNDGSALNANELTANEPLTVIYDSTKFVLQSASTAFVQRQSPNYAVDSGTTNAIAVTLSPALTAHVVGMPIRVKISNTNTNAATFNPGPGAVTIQRRTAGGLVPLSGWELTTGLIYEFIYDGTYYEVSIATGAPEIGYAVFLWTGAAVSILHSSGNLSSITRSSKGLYVANFASGSFTSWATATGSSLNTSGGVPQYVGGGIGVVGTQTVPFNIGDAGGSGGELNDPGYLCTVRFIGV